MTRLRPLFLAAFLAAAGPLVAQTDGTAAPQAEAEAEADTVVGNGQRIGAWTVSCVAVAAGQTSCTLAQRITRTADGAFVADVVALRDGEDKTYLLARVPIGAALPSGFAMREEDSEEMMQFAWQVCSAQLCEALLEIDDAQLAALSAEDNSMIAAFRPTLRAEPFVFQLSLAGMQEGLDALGK